jgi:putative glutamine amidotransferase
MMTLHEVTPEAESLLGHIYNCQTLLVRSGHHQAVNRLGHGLRVTAGAADGVVEAIESGNASWVLGVQWHPEDPEGLRTDLDHLFKHLVFAARSSISMKI